MFIKKIIKFICMKDLNKLSLQQVQSELSRLRDICDTKQRAFDDIWFDSNIASKSFDRYQSELIKILEPERSRLIELSDHYRMIKPLQFSELSDFGDVMSLSDFISNVKSGGFIDYDGFGHYIKDKQESNIEIYPSDIKKGLIRSGFDQIIWFNR